MKLKYFSIRSTFLAATLLFLSIPANAQSNYTGPSAGEIKVNTEGQKTTYSASVTNFSPVATPTDFWNIFGSATRIIRITRIEVCGTTSAATAAILDLRVIKRSTAGTLGSAALTGLTAVPHDSANAAATAVVSTVGTANYTTLGTIVGIVQSRTLSLDLTPFSATDFPSTIPLVFDFTNRNEQGLVLRGTSQQIGLNMNGDTLPAATALDINVVWTEE